MKISFVIPAYNEAKIIKKCLTSVFKEIERAQKASVPFEADVVVVNNASTDKTREEALKFAGITVVDERLKGLVLARRAGFVASDGELVANIDADVLLPQGWLTTVVDEFTKDEKLVALSGPFIYHDLNVFERALVKVFYFFGLMLALLYQHVFRVGALLQGGNFVVRRSALEQVGGYDTSIAFYGEDIDIAKRMSKVGTVRWTFRLPVYSSGRRLKKEGIVASALRYTINNWWVTFFGRPFSYHYKDIRPDAPTK